MAAFQISRARRPNSDRPSVPAAIRQATIILSIRQFKRYDAPLGVAGFGDIGAIRVGRYDPDVEALVSPYKKVRMA